MNFLKTLRVSPSLKNKCYGMILQGRYSSLAIHCYPWRVSCSSLDKLNTKQDRHSHVLTFPKHSSISPLVNKYGTKSHKTSVQEDQTDKKSEDGLKDTEPQLAESGDFKCVYMIKHLHKIRFVSLLKVYQTVFVLGCLPAMIYKCHLGHITTAALLSYGGVMVFSTVMLYIIAAYFMTVVCAMHMDKKAKQVKISHLTFRARRQDIVLDINEIVPVFDINPNRRDLYYHVNTYDNKHKLKLFLNFGTIYDQKAMVDLLGKIL